MQRLKLLNKAGLTGGNQIHLLEGARELFPSMVEAIDKACREVWVACYMFEDTSAPQAVIQSLRGAAQRGVTVRVLVDGFGCLGTLSKLQAYFHHSGVAMAVFRPMHGWKSWLQPRHLHRMHLKLCSVDNELAFVGGINLIDDFFDPRHGWSTTPRLDFALRLSGPIVNAVQQKIRSLWTRAWLGSERHEEEKSQVQPTSPWGRLRLLIQRLKVAPTAPSAAQQDSTQPMQAVFVVRDNIRQRRTIERHYIAAIRQAQERVDIMSPYFYPGRAFLRALRQAAARGVRVRLVLQGKADFQIARFAARALYDEMLARGIEIFEYQPGFLHAKVALVDTHWATVGSSNIDPLSLVLNLEANVIVLDPHFTDTLARSFDGAIAASHKVQSAQPSMLGRLAWQRVVVAWCARTYLRIAGRSGRY